MAHQTARAVGNAAGWGAGPVRWPAGRRWPPVGLGGPAGPPRTTGPREGRPPPSSGGAAVAGGGADGLEAEPQDESCGRQAAGPGQSAEHRLRPGRTVGGRPRGLAGQDPSEDLQGCRPTAPGLWCARSRGHRCWYLCGRRARQPPAGGRSQDCRDPAHPAAARRAHVYLAEARPVPCNEGVRDAAWHGYRWRHRPLTIWTTT
jgi:hypothetical protein